ncbi:sensory protein TspO [Aureimonas sp. SA4125]|uniref:TspO/MBR family protein n=1 Tax=Aureimonas sp. SA4125 TaxID=2826993 RepID=UPI001CC56B4B|nr:TspO/MBR family protein [Aureimonas sp. SA4125]BDA85289.1 sensory protein TspO [Aureimonas sp. SA4125]
MTLASAFALFVFIVIAFAVASSGAIFKPDEWYRDLEKPSWTPPNWAFPLVWSVLYVMIAVSGWIVWGAAGLTAAFIPYGLQYLFNGLWSYIFFRRRRPDIAFFDLVALWLSIAATIAAFAPISATAAWLLVPYLCWVTIAGCLNRSVWRRNPNSFVAS